MQILSRQRLDRARALESNMGITHARIRRAFSERHDSAKVKPRRERNDLDRPSRLIRFTKSLSALSILAALGAPVLALGGTQSITLTWDPSSDLTVAGYNIYHGVTSRTYTNMIDAGNVTSVTIAGLVEGTTYFIAATAYDILGLESDYSGEISYTVPGLLPRVQLRVTPTKQSIVTVTGQVGHTYEIMATQAFGYWTVIGTVTLGASGSSQFIDPNPANLPARFYRTQDTQP